MPVLSTSSFVGWVCGASLILVDCSLISLCATSLRMVDSSCTFSGLCEDSLSQLSLELGCHVEQ